MCPPRCGPMCPGGEALCVLGVRPYVSAHMEEGRVRN